MYSRTQALSRDSIETQFKRKFTWVKSQMQSGHRVSGETLCLKNVRRRCFFCYFDFYKIKFQKKMEAAFAEI